MAWVIIPLAWAAQTGSFGVTESERRDGCNYRQKAQEITSLKCRLPLADISAISCPTLVMAGASEHVCRGVCTFLCEAAVCIFVSPPPAETCKDPPHPHTVWMWQNVSALTWHERRSDTFRDEVQMLSLTCLSYATRLDHNATLLLIRPSASWLKQLIFRRWGTNSLWPLCLCIWLEMAITRGLSN